MDKMSEAKMSKWTKCQKTKCPKRQNAPNKMSPPGYVWAPRNCPEDSNALMEMHWLSFD